MRRTRRLAMRAIWLWVSTALLLCRWSLRLLRYLGLNATWILLMWRLIAFALLLAVPLLRTFFWYWNHRSVERGIRYGPFRRNDYDVCRPPDDDALFIKCLSPCLKLLEAPNATPSRQRAVDAVRSVRPSLLFVPGGAWAIGYKAWGAAFARSLAAAGIRVICTDHRNFPQARISGQVSDIDAAIDHVQASLLEHGQDNGGGGGRETARYLYVCGQSAGAHLAACAVLERAVRYARHMKGPRTGHATARAPPPIRRYIGISGPYDVIGMVTAMARRGISSDALQSLFEGDMERFSPSRYVSILSTLGPWEEDGGERDSGEEGDGARVGDPHGQGLLADGQEAVTRAVVQPAVGISSGRAPIPASPARLVLPLASPTASSPSPMGGPAPTVPPSQGAPWLTRVRKLTYDATGLAEDMLESTEAQCRHRGEQEGQGVGKGISREPSFTHLFSLPVSGTGILRQRSDSSSDDDERGGSGGQDVQAQEEEERDTLQPLDLHVSNPGPVEATALLSSVVVHPHVQLGSPTGFHSPPVQRRGAAHARGEQLGPAAASLGAEERGTGSRTAGQDIISSLPPMTLLHGAADDTVEASMSILYAAEVHRAGVRCCTREEDVQGVGQGQGHGGTCTHAIRVRIFASATHTDPVLEGALSAGALPGPQGKRTDSTHIVYAALVHAVGVLFRWIWLLLRLLCLPVSLPWSVGSRLASAGLDGVAGEGEAASPMPLPALPVGMQVGELGSHVKPGPLYSVTHPHIAQHEDAGLGSGDALIEDIVATIARDVLLDHGLLEPVLQAWREQEGQGRGQQGQTCGRMDQSSAPLPRELLDLSHARALAPPLASAWLCALARKVNPF